MEENNQIIDEKLSKIAILSEGIGQLFNGKTSTLVVLNKDEFENWRKTFSRIKDDSDLFKVN